MAGTRRASDRDLIAEIQGEGHRFQFGQAVRLLARHSGQSPLPPGIRFRTPPSLAFPASEIAAVKPLDHDGGGAGDRGGGMELTVAFMGLTGPSGVLPAGYTELLMERCHHHRDAAAHAFFDLFSHRAVALFYEAWRKYRFYLAYEAGEREGFTRNLMDLVGAGTAAVQRRLEQQDKGVCAGFVAYFSGLLAQKPLSAASLGALVQGGLGVETVVEQFVGQWQPLAVTEQTRLARQACTLGRSTVCGQRVWDRQHKIRLRLGPLNRAAFEAFTPGSPGAAALREMVRFCLGHSLACDVVLLLTKKAVPAPLLGGQTEVRLRLGFNCWLWSRPPASDPADMQYALLA